jgi:hypothetical protein
MWTSWRRSQWTARSLARGARFSSALQDRLTHRMRVGGFVLTGVSVVVMGLS